MDILTLFWIAFIMFWMPQKCLCQLHYFYNLISSDILLLKIISCKWTMEIFSLLFTEGFLFYSGNWKCLQIKQARMLHVKGWLTQSLMEKDYAGDFWTSVPRFWWHCLNTFKIIPLDWVKISGMLAESRWIHEIANLLLNIIKINYIGLN